jgi:TM2 domain-containing membrane protein YozV
MKKKSKFITFLLSFVPGLGHIYLGLMQRGIVFLLATAFVILGGAFFSMLGIFYGPIPFVVLPFIWLAGLVDSLIFADRINFKLAESPTAGSDPDQVSKILENEFKDQNTKILALTFSIIPGAGHMYLGQMEKGIQLMSAFFLTLYLSDFLNISLLLMIAPIFWFYSIFDVLQKISRPQAYKDVTFLGNFFQEGQFSGKAGKYIGIGLIAAGCLIILDKIVMPEISIFLNEQIREYFRTGIVAVLFIAGGVKLLWGNKTPEKKAVATAASKMLKPNQDTAEGTDEE